MADTDTSPPTDSFGSVDIDRIIRGALPQTNVDVPKIQKGLAHVGREEAATKDAFIGRDLRRMEADVAAVHKAQRGIDPVDIRPWDADKEREKYSTSPLEQFGSFAFIAATLASAFTRQPMTNALNAAGAAMEAANKRDSENYDRASEAFKTNAELAIKRHNLQHEAYQDAIERLNVDREVGTSELAMLAAKFGDKRAQTLIEGGYIKELIEMQQANQRAFEGMAKLLPEFQKIDVQQKQLAMDPDYQSGDPQRVLRAKQRVFETNNLTPEQQIWAQHVRENPDESSEDRAKFFQSLKMFGARTTIDQLRRQEVYDATIADWKRQHPGEEVPLEVKLQANNSAIGKVGKAFDQKTLDDMADIYMGGNTSVMTNLARGVQGPENLVKFWQTVSKKMLDKGMTSADINKARMDFAGALAASRTLQNRGVMLELASNEAEMLVPRVKAVSDRINRTQYPTINSVILAAEKGTGGEDVIRLGVSLESLKYVYARALKPTGVINESDTKRAEHILDIAWSKGQINAALDQMMIELESAAQGLEKTKAAHYPGHRESTDTGAPTPTQEDIDYAKAHPEARQQFIDHFKVEP